MFCYLFFNIVLLKAQYICVGSVASIFYFLATWALSLPIYSFPSTCCRTARYICSSLLLFHFENNLCRVEFCARHIFRRKCLICIYFSMKGDVYPVEAADGFSVSQVLDAHWGVLNDEDVRPLKFFIIIVWSILCCSS